MFWCTIILLGFASGHVINIGELKRILPLEEESNDELNALREQPVKESRVRRDSPRNYESGSGSSSERKSMAKTIAGFEGLKTKVYEDTKGIKTVGVGFNMEQPNARTTFKKYLPEVSFDDIFSGKKELTEKQAINLFQKTLDSKIKTTKNLFPSYDEYPEAVKTALVNGVFRGEFKSTDKTVKYINNGQWDKVAGEYLDRKDYRESIPGKNGGIKTRMNFNANIFREHAKELKEEE